MCQGVVIAGIGREMVVSCLSSSCCEVVYDSVCEGGGLSYVDVVCVVDVNSSVDDVVYFVCVPILLEGRVWELCVVLL
jgi:hypothetical protein